MRKRIFHSAARVSSAALWSVRSAGFAFALIVAGIALHRLFELSTPIFINILLAAFGLATFAVVLAIVGLGHIWASGARGTGAAAIGALLGLGLLAWPGAYVPQVVTQAPLNDVTTDYEAPPEFATAATARPDGANPIAYAGRTAARVQETLYPDLQPLIVNRPASETFELVVQAVKRSGYQVVSEDEPDRGKPGRVEAVARTVLIGFRDDVVIRVIGRRERSRVDIRSASRWGIYDFGANARRVRALTRTILERLSATVPGGTAR